MAQEIRVDPIDLELDTAIGIDLPIDKSVGSTFKQTYLTIDAAYANARNLLLTNKGERVMHPDLGCDLNKSIFEFLDGILTTDIDNKIRTQFQYWLPYIFINELTVTPSPDENSVFVKLTISLSGSEFDTRSIILEVNRT
jgi:phage baseplate assembly protein W